MSDLNDLESLINAAERVPDSVAVPAASTADDHVRCINCQGSLTGDGKPCKTGHGPFCDNCISILDPDYCKLCLSEPDAELKILPLKDTDGVQHEGREMIPVGPVFGTLTKHISDMTMAELEAHIDNYVNLIRQAEKALDFRRVVLGMSRLERDQRKDAERRKLRGIRVRVPGQPTQKTGSSGGATKSTTKSNGAATTVSGVQLAQMLAALQMLKTKSKPTAATVAPQTVTQTSPPITITTPVAPRRIPRPGEKKL